jgi:hypothetical protein
VTLSFDTYSSNKEMITRWHENKQRYDILIFSDTIYDAISKDISLKKSNLSEHINKYNSSIKKRFLSRNYPKNIAFFAHALTGFIWNPAIINLTSSDNVKSAFEKAKKNKVILLDDPAEINMLLSVGINQKIKQSKSNISISSLKEITQDAHVYISNDANQIYHTKEFAFSYQWSGEAFNNFVLNEKYSFLINQNLSYISTDLIAQVKNNADTACVANYLASEKYLSKLQLKTKYFSPYTNIDSVTESPYKNAYRIFIKKLPSLRWLDSTSAKQLKKIENEWDIVKYELLSNSE